MYLRKCRKTVGKANYVYWQLVESQRTAKGPRQQVVAYLGDMHEALRVGVAQAATANRVRQQGLFDEQVVPEWVEIDVSRVRVERAVDFGAYWLGVQIMERLDLPWILDSKMKAGREEIPWSVMTAVLVLARLVDPSSELRIAEHLFERTALADLLSIPAEKINDDRLYRTLDQVLPHKNALEKHLKERLGQIFKLEYDLLLFDITSTYFEGACQENKEARFGYSRDKRSDCKQVCIALVVSREGIPLGYEVFAGNRKDATTVEEIIKKIEDQYGRADRIWVMDRGMVSEKTLALLQSEGRRYIIGTPRGLIGQYQAQLSSEEGWQEIAEGLSAKLIGAEQDRERLLLCRSVARGEKEKAMLERFEQKLEEGLKKLAKSCSGKRRWREETVQRRIGALQNKNSRAKSLFKIKVGAREDGGATVEWEKLEQRAKWATLKAGCYVLRTNVAGTVEELWRTYMQLTEAEAAFRIQKNDLRIRPIWHQKQERVGAHILVCFLAYVLWKTLAQMCKAAKIGNEPRKVIDELSGIRMVDVVLPTRNGVELRRRCISEPTAAQAILLERLKLRLPRSENVQPV